MCRTSPPTGHCSPGHTLRQSSSEQFSTNAINSLLKALKRPAKSVARLLITVLLLQCEWRWCNWDVDYFGGDSKIYLACRLMDSHRRPDHGGRRARNGIIG